MVDISIVENNLVTIKALNYFCINHGDQIDFSFEIIINVLVSSVSFEYLCYWSTAIRIDFSRQNLTSTD